MTVVLVQWPPEAACPFVAVADAPSCGLTVSRSGIRGPVLDLDVITTLLDEGKAAASFHNVCQRMCDLLQPRGQVISLAESLGPQTFTTSLE